MPRRDDRTCSSAELAFRPFREGSDYERMCRIVAESEEADQSGWAPTLDEIRAWCAPTARFDPSKQIVFAAAPSEAASEVGVTRVSWYTTRGGVLVYPQFSFLAREWRRPGVWLALVEEGDRRIRDLAASHPESAGCVCQGWATETQREWIAALKSAGYAAVRHFRNMVRPLAEVPPVEDAPLPSGLELRLAGPEVMRSIWDAQAEVNQELFEYMAEQWAENRYGRWLADPSHTPDLWQVAWDGDEVAGMVLPRVDPASFRAGGRRRGFTEHVFVRRPWRGRGLAKALLIRSLHALCDAGMTEAELGVDSENDSGAYGFYERLGYVTERTDIWFRKPLDPA